MTKSKIVLGGTAFILAIAGALATRAAKTGHSVSNFKTKVNGSCSSAKGSGLSGVTITDRSGNVKTVSGHTAYTLGCVKTLWTTAN